MSGNNPDDDDPARGPVSIGALVATVRQPPPNMPVVPAMEPREPKLSAPLVGVVQAMANPHPDLGTRGVALPQALRREAETAFARYQQLAQPAAHERICDWLVGVNSGMAQPLPKNELSQRVTELAASLREMPAGVFNSGTRQDAQIAFQWFPGVKEVHDFLRPLAAPVVSKRLALERLLATEEPPIGQRLEPEERQAIVDEFRRRLEQVKAERLADDPAPPSEAKPRYLTREQLRMAYRELAAGEHSPEAASAARARLRMLGEDASEAPRKESSHAAEIDAEDEINPW